MDNFTTAMICRWLTEDISWHSFGSGNFSDFRAGKVSQKATVIATTPQSKDVDNHR